jgi:hypothetical protein
MSTSQKPINNTTQIRVPPGDESGYYYILLSNARVCPDLQLLLIC